MGGGGSGRKQSALRKDVSGNRKARILRRIYGGRNQTFARYVKDRYVSAGHDRVINFTDDTALRADVFRPVGAVGRRALLGLNYTYLEINSSGGNGFSRNGHFLIIL